ncbi:type I-E CRISPR-associated protein Cse1/CasA [Trinickia caryophylli]|uniref:CRISPR-associated protein, Cse1 family n=1 Tax=Trinickia caryophylli TaxID=28094 RepID=A0A1X7FSB9_TRICW|nr:type I-E CRISPR-associated protein Cse1/CasA [Trinickia caryophylli]PMS11962.1 type I-E CRISPR-associated protein Cse1/CasA [Trinickia caryophylli]WQE15685.1 type I-E CRISPR-associated protein Cse1/CasA [Trinickia caryophylli]GLU33692.1 type I-E CRISPR-associated protein Cse1/CasA [Trinickia caryophylli]SMF57860.1 CRISPR-associated protein, Cse1 family [Trinickia caryophylli]
MNLLDSGTAWLRLRRRDSSVKPGTVYDIADPDVVDVLAPRADFRGALYQLLIGVLQTAAPPSNLNDWLTFWREPPEPAQLAEWFKPLLPAFTIFGDTAFMQDRDPLNDGNAKSTAELLIDTGSSSNQFFNKQPDWQGLCASCVAQALFTLQINAPLGGRGHLTSLRGGGPLTTLVLPKEADASLWNKLWLNVLPLAGEDEAWREDRPLSDKLPWLAATRVSDKNGTETRPEDVHPAHAYWSMSRRIRLDPDDIVAGACEVCGEKHNTLYRRYRASTYGTDYAGPWQHPLTPYWFDDKDLIKSPTSLKGSRVARGYRYWLTLTMGENSTEQVARAVWDFNRKGGKADKLKWPGGAVLWCFGYRMDNMKAEAWHDATLPLVRLASADERHFVDAVRSLLEVSRQSALMLADQVKKARRMDKKEPAVEQSFWQRSEALFYQVVEQLAKSPQLDDAAQAQAFLSWLAPLRRLVLELFDYWVLCAPIEEMDMAEVVSARADLQRGLWHAKPHKTMGERIAQYQRESDEAVSR